MSQPPTPPRLVQIRELGVPTVTAADRVSTRGFDSQATVGQAGKCEDGDGNIVR
jgi:hypothetical protein